MEISNRYNIGDIEYIVRRWRYRTNSIYFEGYIKQIVIWKHLIDSLENEIPVSNK